MKSGSLNLRPVNRTIAAGCYWLCPILFGIVYVAVTYQWEVRPDRHGFEQGWPGFWVATTTRTVICTVNLLGYLAAQLIVGSVNSAYRLAPYVLSGVAGIISLIAFSGVALGSRHFNSTSELFWISYFVTGALLSSLLIGIAAFLLGFGRKWIYRNKRKSDLTE